MVAKVSGSLRLRLSWSSPMATRNPRTSSGNTPILLRLPVLPQVDYPRTFDSFSSSSSTIVPDRNSPDCTSQEDLFQLVEKERSRSHDRNVMNKVFLHVKA